ncbi:mucin-22-like [Ptychodera flava]|uniref:mucin-22-like n=1 Tax=Ptychodera flava TaxID=63121 RepID=UPI003969F856
MADRVADYPNVLPSRIRMSSLRTSVNDQGNQRINENGYENGHGPGKSSTNPHVNDKLAGGCRTAPDCNGKVTGKPLSGSQSNQTTTAKSMFKRILFRKSAREKKKDRGKVSAENETEVSAMRLKGQSSVDSCNGTTLGSVDRPGLRPELSNGNPAPCGTESVMSFGLRRSASMNCNGGKESFLRDNSGLHRSASFSTGRRPTSGERKPFKPEHGSICENSRSESLLSANAGYDPVWISRHNIAKANKHSYRRSSNEQIQLNEMTKSSSTTTLNISTPTLYSETKVKSAETIWQPRDQSTYSPSSQVFEKRQLKADTSLGTAVKLASKTKSKKKKDKVTGDIKSQSTKKSESHKSYRGRDDEEVYGQLCSHAIDGKTTEESSIVKRRSTASTTPPGKPSGSVFRNSSYSPSDITNTITNARPKSMVYSTTECMGSRTQQQTGESASNRSFNSQPTNAIVENKKPDRRAKGTIGELELLAQPPVSPSTEGQQRSSQSKRDQQLSGSSSLAFVNEKKIKNKCNYGNSSAETEGNDPRSVEGLKLAYGGEHSRTLRSTMEKKRLTINQTVNSDKKSVMTLNDTKRNSLPEKEAEKMQKGVRSMSPINTKDGKLTKSRIPVSPQKQSHTHSLRSNTGAGQDNDANKTQAIIQDSRRAKPDHKNITAPDRHSNLTNDDLRSCKTRRSLPRQNSKAERRECGSYVREPETKTMNAAGMKSPQKSSGSTQVSNKILNSRGCSYTEETEKGLSNVKRVNGTQTAVVRNASFGQLDKSKSRPRSAIYQRDEKSREFNRNSSFRRSFHGVIRGAEVPTGRSTVDVKKLSCDVIGTTETTEGDRRRCTSPSSKLPRPVVSPRKDTEKVVSPKNKVTSVAKESGTHIRESQMAVGQNVPAEDRGIKSLRQKDGKLSEREARKKRIKQKETVNANNKPLTAEMNTNTSKTFQRESVLGKSAMNQDDMLPRNITKGESVSSPDVESNDLDVISQECRASNSGTFHQNHLSGTETAMSQSSTASVSTQSTIDHRTKRTNIAREPAHLNVTRAGHSNIGMVSTVGEITTLTQCKGTDSVTNCVNVSNGNPHHQKGSDADSVRRSPRRTLSNCVKAGEGQTEPGPMKQANNELYSNGHQGDVISHESTLSDTGQDSDYLKPLKHAESISVNGLMDGVRPQSESNTTPVDFGSAQESQNNGGISSAINKTEMDVVSMANCPKENSITQDSKHDSRETENHRVGQQYEENRSTSMHQISEQASNHTLRTLSHGMPPTNQHPQVNQSIGGDVDGTDCLHREGSLVEDKQVRGVAIPEREVNRSPGTFRVIVSVSPNSKSEILTPTRKHPKSRNRMSPHGVTQGINKAEQKSPSQDPGDQSNHGKSPLKKSALPRPAAGSFHSNSAKSSVSDSVDGKLMQTRNSGERHTHESSCEVRRASTDESDVLSLTKSREANCEPRGKRAASQEESRYISTGGMNAVNLQTPTAIVVGKARSQPSSVQVCSERCNTGEPTSVTGDSDATQGGNAEQFVCKSEQQMKGDASTEKMPRGISQSETKVLVLSSSHHSKSFLHGIVLPDFHPTLALDRNKVAAC